MRPLFSTALLFSLCAAPLAHAQPRPTTVSPAALPAQPSVERACGRDGAYRVTESRCGPEEQSVRLARVRSDGHEYLVFAQALLLDDTMLESTWLVVDGARVEVPPPAGASPLEPVDTRRAEAALRARVPAVSARDTEERRRWLELFFLALEPLDATPLAAEATPARARALLAPADGEARGELRRARWYRSAPRGMVASPCVYFRGLSVVLASTGEVRLRREGYAEGPASCTHGSARSVEAHGARRARAPR